MSCPACGCKVCYQFDDEDDGEDDRMQRCSACGHIFDIDDHTEEGEGDDG